MRAFKFAAIALVFGNLVGCVAAPQGASAVGLPPASASQVRDAPQTDQLRLNEIRTTMNVEGGHIGTVSQDFSDEVQFQMRISKENPDAKWSPVVGVCLKEASSPAGACMQFARIPSMGPDYRAVFYYLANKQAPRQHGVILVDHTAVLGQTVNVSVKQKADKLVFSINGKEETFPVSLNAGTIEFHCSSGVCEFRD